METEKIIAVVVAGIFAVLLFLLNAYLLQIGYNGSLAEMFFLPKMSHIQAVCLVIALSAAGLASQGHRRRSRSSTTPIKE